jgi:transcriptional regulator with XRE-family HTH domain
MTTAEFIPVTRSLEDYRRERLLTIKQFAAQLGMNEQTYRRLLADPESVRMPVKHRARAALGVSPYLVSEFYPTPSPVLRAQILAAYERGNAEGWVVVDPDTLEPTGEILDDEGKPM